MQNNAMKQPLIFSLSVFLVVMASCGSSRKAVSHQRQPDTSVSPLDKATPTPTNIRTTSKNKTKTPEERLSYRLDSLLQTADTLLRISQLGMHVIDLSTGKVLYAFNASQRMRPASTEKVVTAITALDQLGPSYPFSTKLLATAPLNGRVLQGDLYIKGCMDPLLTQSDVRQLANQLKAMGVHTINGHLVADASFKDSDEYGWGWCWDDENPTLSPLLVGGKPGLAAALRTALKNAGITLKKGVTHGTAPANARELAAINRPLTAVLQPMMKESDNLCAEAVFYQLRPTSGPSRNGAQGKHYSRKLAAGAVEDVIERAYSLQSLASITGGDGSVIADGSGLSLYNYQTPETFTHLLAYAAARPDSVLNPLLEAMPIAAVDGTLKKRMAGTEAAANVRAKTGSVTAVSTLVGYTTQRSTGHLIAFAIMNQGVERMAQGRALQDQVCILLSQ